MKTDDARYQKSRAAIIETSIARLLANPEASMSELALAAGVGRATLYRHFETREDLIKELARICLEETDQALAPIKSRGEAGLPAILASIDAIAPMADRFRFLMSLLNITADDREIRKIYQRQLNELIEQVEIAKGAGEIDRSIPTSWIVASYDASLNAAWHLVQHNEINSDEAATLLRDTFVKSFGSSQGG